MTKRQDIRPGLYHGAYSYGEAAVLLGVTSSRVRRWADGYTFARKMGKGASKPILQTERVQGVLSFYELIELMFVKEYVGLQVALPHIRSTAEELGKRLGPYPFASQQLYVGDRKLLQPYVDGSYIRPDIGQIVAGFADVLQPQLTFDHNVAHRYTPSEYKGLIFLDAQISAGEPVVTEHAVPTRVVYGLWQREHDIEAVADYFDLSNEAVSAAVRFEGQCQLAA